MSIEGLKSEIFSNARLYNKSKRELYSTTIICSVVNVNEDKYSVDVFVPTTAAKIKDVIIGTGVVSDSGTTISMLPTKGQKALVLISNQHPPVLIATIPNKRIENRSSLLEGELLFGNKDSKIKVSKDKSIYVKTQNNIFSFNDIGQNLISNSLNINADGVTSVFGEESGYASETYSFIEKKDYFIEKKDLILGNNINYELKNKIINDNILLVNTLTDIVNLIKENNKELNFDDLEGVEKLKNLKIKLSTFGVKDSDSKLKINKGFKDGKAFEILFENKNEEISSMIFNDNGEIVFNCKNLIVNKEDSVYE